MNILRATTLKRLISAAFDFRCDNADGSDYSSLFDTASRVTRRDYWWFSTTVIKSAWYQVTPSFVGCGILDADVLLLPLCGNDYFSTRYVMVMASTKDSLRIWGRCWLLSTWRWMNANKPTTDFIVLQLQTECGHQHWFLIVYLFAADLRATMFIWRTCAVVLRTSFQ